MTLSAFRWFILWLQTVSGFHVTIVGTWPDCWNWKIFWADLTLQHNSGFWQNFAMTSVETLYKKEVINELSFLLVTHTTCFDTWLGRYGFLNLGYGAELILDRLM
jgi:hypothetical protein